MLIALFVAVALAQPAPCQPTQGATDANALARALVDAILKKDVRAVDALLVDECASEDARFRLDPRLAEKLAKVQRSGKLDRELDKSAARVVEQGLAPIGELVFWNRDPDTAPEGRTWSFDAYFKSGSAWRELDFVAVRIGARWYLGDDDFDLRDATDKGPRQYWSVIFERLVMALANTGDPDTAIDTWWSTYRATLQALAPQVCTAAGADGAREPYLWILHTLGAKAATLDGRLKPIEALFGEAVTLARPFGNEKCDRAYVYFEGCFGTREEDRTAHRMILAAFQESCEAFVMPADGKCPQSSGD